MREIFYIYAFSITDTSHMWLLSTLNVSSVIEELILNIISL